MRMKQAAIHTMMRKMNPALNWNNNQAI